MEKLYEYLQDEYRDSEIHHTKLHNLLTRLMAKDELDEEDYSLDFAIGMKKFINIVKLERAHQLGLKEAYAGALHFIDKR